MSKVRPSPCEACPYRRDVPSGVWAEHEYDKLVEYDRPTGYQPLSAFSCHASPEALCHGWAVVHMNRGSENELIALRLPALAGVTIPEPAVPLFSSGTEAAEHGKADIEAPTVEAKVAQHRLMRKHPRLRFRHD